MLAGVQPYRDSYLNYLRLLIRQHACTKTIVTNEEEFLFFRVDWTPPCFSNLDNFLAVVLWQYLGIQLKLLQVQNLL